MKTERVKVADIFDNPCFMAQAEKYRLESGNPRLTGAPDRVAYEQLELLGLLSAVGVYHRGELVGFAGVVFAPSLHNSKLVANVDTLWLDPEYRLGTAGLRLIRACLDLAREKNAAGVRFSAPAKSRLSVLLSKLFTHSDNTFYTSLE